MKKIYILFILIVQVSYGQISIGQTSTFNTDNDFEGWDNLNSSFTPVTVAGGFLTASGSPSILPGTIPPNRLIIDNITWGGNYTSVGVGGIRFDVRNLSGEDMNLAILLFDDETGNNITIAETTTIVIPASATSFETYTISLLPAELTVTGPKSSEDLLVDILGISITRIDNNGDGTESLDFDNIEVLSVADLSVDDYFSNNASVSVLVKAGILNIVSTINSEIKAIKIYDITGKIVKEINGSKANVSDLSNGVYIAVIKNVDGRIVSRKFIK